ncbi:hypothetical protein AeRB84_006788 [Aphanomyces euteiches]|nr:hypothetical protein AeRB84_006788 [Aphanomyces euteiches]
MSTYSIVRSLEGHGGAVRAICDVQSTVVTGAMDAAVISWDDTQPQQSIYDHSHWVTALIPLDTQHEALLSSAGGFVTGGMDMHVRVFTKATKEQEFVCVIKLEGHTSGVISLTWTQEKESILLSGSWDGTCRGWDIRSQTCRFVLPDHENGVCVLGLSNGRIATGSTGRQQGNQVVDACIRMWDAVSPFNYTLMKTLTDHQGPVRQLVSVDEIGFASCSNDGTIKLRAAEDGEVLMTCSHPLNHEGKPAFVLGLAYLPKTQHLVSVSEDCTARVWTLDGSCLQTIEHPSGLWCVAPLSNGDFATGAEDKTVRVFSTSGNDPALAAVLTAQVAEAHVQKSRGPSAVEIEKLPAYEARGSHVGKSDGMIQMFRRDNVAWACQWNAISGTWLDIGQVTGTGSGGVIDGEAYDMVIPVEIETPSGIRKLEIGYNQGQNPFAVAQAFIDKHFLNQSYLKEIADYITQRSENYQPPVLGTENTSFLVQSSSSAPSVSSVFFPAKVYTSFDTAKIAKLHSTLVQFNADLESPARLTDSELELAATLIQTLLQTSFYHSSSIPRTQAHVVLKILDRWPLAKVFPGLDLCRLLLVHPLGGELLSGSPIVATVLRLGFSDKTVTDATRFLAIRVLCNMFLHPSTRSSVVAATNAVLETIAPWTNSNASKPLAISIASLLLNYTIAGTTTPELISKALHSMLSPSLDEETFGRVLVALATLARIKQLTIY